MVEFGLKLEDNKVQEWNDQYIDYEGLKKLIKAAKKASEAKAELEKRNPSLAAELKAIYEKELKQSLSDSNSALNKITEKDGDDEGDDASAGEKSRLLLADDRSVNEYGANDFKKITHAESESSLGYFFRGVKKSMSISNYEDRLRDALQVETLAVEKFSIAVFQEVSDRIATPSISFFRSEATNQYHAS